MAHFSNGTEFDIWQNDNCIKCRHDMSFCPILIIYSTYNSDQFIDEKIKGILGAFIPTGDDGFPGQCEMLMERNLK